MTRSTLIIGASPSRLSPDPRNRIGSIACAVGVLAFALVSACLIVLAGR